MNQYEAIFVRKTVRNYVNEAVSPEILEEIRTRCREFLPLFEGTDTDISIIDNRKGQLRRLGLFGVRAPYCILFYSEVTARYQMNIGFLMQQMALYLCSQGYGTCFVGDTHVRRELREKGDLVLTGMLAFGRSKGSCTRKRTEAKRLPMDELCVYRETPKSGIRSLLEAGRMAPSSQNAQPWRFVVMDSRIHIFTKKHQFSQMSRYRWEEVDFGILLANMMVTAEELWLDVDLIRLENLTQKSFPSSQYVLSAVLKS